MSRGLLLVNLGTPLSCEVRDVRAFLGQFLMDRHVLDVPWLLRRLIVSGFIEQDVDRVRAALEREGLRTVDSASDPPWALAVLRRGS